MSAVKKFISDNKAVLILFAITYIVSALYTPWEVPGIELNIDAIDDPKLIRWAYLYFWSGFSDIFGLAGYGISKGDTGFVFLVMAIFSIQKLAANKIVADTHDNIILKYIKTNIYFSISAYMTYFLSLLLEKYMAENWFDAILVICTLLILPADIFILVYFGSFILSFYIINYALEAIDLPIMIETAAACVVIIALALLTDQIADKALYLTVKMICSKIPLLRNIADSFLD